MFEVGAHFACGTPLISTWLFLVLCLVKAEKRISLPGTAVWEKMDPGACTSWTPTPSNQSVNEFRTKLAVPLTGIQASDINVQSVVCKEAALKLEELRFTFEIELRPSAADFQAKSTEVIQLLRDFRDNAEEREKLNKALKVSGYPKKVGQIEIAMWKCEAKCVSLTGTPQNFVTIWLGFNTTTLPPTEPPTTTPPEPCPFHMLWLFNDLTENCMLQAGATFGGFASLIVCCPILVLVCIWKKKQMLDLVCGFDEPHTLSTQAEKIEDEETSEKKDGLSQQDSASEDNASSGRRNKYASLQDKVNAKKAVQLDETEHAEIIPAYKDGADVEYYSVRNACWTIAKLRIFVVENKEKYGSKDVKAHLKKVYGIEMNMGEGLPVQWRYNIELKLLRLPLAQGEDVEVCGKDGLFSSGKVEGPRTTFRQQSPNGSFRQHLGYNVRLHSTDELLRLQAAERVRRFFAVEAPVEYYTGPERGWLRAIVRPIEGCAKDWELQPWRVGLFGDPAMKSQEDLAMVGFGNNAVSGTVIMTGSMTAGEALEADAFGVKGSNLSNAFTVKKTNNSWEAAMAVANNQTGRSLNTRASGRVSVFGEDNKADLWTHVTISCEQEGSTLPNGKLDDLVVPSYLLRAYVTRRSMWL
jgi:hypothetical protein